MSFQQLKSHGYDIPEELLLEASPQQDRVGESANQ